MLITNSYCFSFSSLVTFFSLGEPHSSYWFSSHQLIIIISKYMLQVGIFCLYFQSWPADQHPFPVQKLILCFLPNGFAFPLLKSDQLLVWHYTESSHNLKPILVEKNLLCKTGEIMAQTPVLHTLGGSYKLQISLENLIQGLSHFNGFHFLLFSLFLFLSLKVSHFSRQRSKARHITLIRFWPVWK